MAVIDSYTHYILEFMEGINKTSQTTMEDLVRPHYRTCLQLRNVTDRMREVQLL